MILYLRKKNSSKVITREEMALHAVFRTSDFGFMNTSVFMSIRNGLLTAYYAKNPILQIHVISLSKTPENMQIRIRRHFYVVHMS